MKNLKTGDDGAEREAIVAWLRKQAGDLEKEQAKSNKWTAEWLSLREQIESAQEFADAIERGEHLAVRSHIIGEDK